MKKCLVFTQKLKEKMLMKRISTFITTLSLIFIMSILVSCGQNTKPDEENTHSQNSSVTEKNGYSESKNDELSDSAGSTSSDDYSSLEDYPSSSEEDYSTSENDDSYGHSDSLTPSTDIDNTLDVLDIDEGKAGQFELLYSTVNTPFTPINGELRQTTVSANQPFCIQCISTYHWNDGKGETPGEIWVECPGGISCGSWKAEGRSINGVENAIWDCYPEDLVFEANVSYFIMDSSAETASLNEKNHAMYDLRGISYDDNVSELFQKSEQTLTETYEYEQGIIGPAQNAIFTHNGATVQLGSEASGDAAWFITSDQKGPDGTATNMHCLALTTLPTDSLAISMETEEPAEGEMCHVQIGIPMTNGFEEQLFWVPLETEYTDGIAKATVDLTAIPDFADSISGVSNSIWQYNQASIDIANAQLRVLHGIYFVLTKGCEGIRTDHFSIHVPSDLWGGIGERKEFGKIYASDIYELGLDMEGILTDFVEKYGFDISQRSKWPMDVWVKESSDTAYFAMPALSIGGRLGNDSINFGDITVDCTNLKTGYKVQGTWNESDAFVYGTLAHEMYHFIQRCYYSKACTQLWYDESSASYFDYLYSSKAGYPVLDQNVEKNNIKQWTVFPQSIMVANGRELDSSLSFTKSEYAFAPLFSSLMQDYPDYMRKSCEFLRDTGGFNTWTDVLTSVTGSEMKYITKNYFAALVQKGTLFAAKGSFEPWIIAEDLYNGGKKFGSIGEVVTIDKCDDYSFSYTIPAYGVHFVALKFSADIPPYTSYSLKMPPDGIEVFEISGWEDRYDHNDYGTAVWEGYDNCSFGPGGVGYQVLMFVNTNGKNYSGGFFGGTVTQELTYWEQNLGGEEVTVQSQIPEKLRGYVDMLQQKDNKKTYCHLPIGDFEVKLDGDSLYVRIMTKDESYSFEETMKYDKTSGKARGKYGSLKFSWYSSGDDDLRFNCIVRDDEQNVVATFSGLNAAYCWYPEDQVN